MKRYQLYLNQTTVAIVDRLQEVVNIPRTKIIRESLDRGVGEYIHLLTKLFIEKEKKPSYSVLDKMVGFIKTKSKKKTHYANMVDEIVYAKENL